MFACSVAVVKEDGSLACLKQRMAISSNNSCCASEGMAYQSKRVHRLVHHRLEAELEFLNNA